MSRKVKVQDRPQVFQFFLTHAALKAIRKAAILRGITMSAFVRRAALDAADRTMEGRQ